MPSTITLSFISLLTILSCASAIAVEVRQYYDYGSASGSPGITVSAPAGCGVNFINGTPTTVCATPAAATGGAPIIESGSPGSVIPGSPGYYSSTPGYTFTSSGIAMSTPGSSSSSGGTGSTGSSGSGGAGGAGGTGGTGGTGSTGSTGGTGNSGSSGQQSPAAASGSGATTTGGAGALPTADVRMVGGGLAAVMALAAAL